MAKIDKSRQRIEELLFRRLNRLMNKHSRKYPAPMHYKGTIEPGHILADWQVPERFSDDTLDHLLGHLSFIADLEKYISDTTQKEHRPDLYGSFAIALDEVLRFYVNTFVEMKRIISWREQRRGYDQCLWERILCNYSFETNPDFKPGPESIGILVLYRDDKKIWLHGTSKPIDQCDITGITKNLNYELFHDPRKEFLNAWMYGYIDMAGDPIYDTENLVPKGAVLFASGKYFTGLHGEGQQFQVDADEAALPNSYPLDYQMVYDCLSPICFDGFGGIIGNFYIRLDRYLKLDNSQSN